MVALYFPPFDSICILSVSYLFYGPFTSFAPSYDSSRANLTKEESDLLISSYTDVTGVQFSHRLVSVKFGLDGMEVSR